MESDSWSRFSRRHHQSALQSRYGRSVLGVRGLRCRRGRVVAGGLPLPFLRRGLRYRRALLPHRRRAPGGVQKRSMSCLCSKGWDGHGWAYNHAARQFLQDILLNIATTKEIPPWFIWIPFNTFFAEERAKGRKSTSSSRRVIIFSCSFQCGARPSSIVSDLLVTCV
ncbi:protein DEHYDRATION-INDUCED 19-like protein 2-like isoform X1 [Iris pallida]|uniref:Protein DEHYDRATION-INDUCED 19-like protein 2-like isoform X1 n=1 Tax=Iris pallida TaxID=29817 RepID=A0AAX6F260_IRIPA|nr:protein DEHYDRATION-INDUCED 19-like protein 2-like isoform X1 [Iris pallida]